MVRTLITSPFRARTLSRLVLCALRCAAIIFALTVLPAPGRASSGETDPTVVMGVGDSVTFGVGAPDAPAGGYLPLLQNLLAGSAVTRNHGIPGATSGELLAQLDGLLDAERPGLTIIMIGVNDALHGVPARTTVDNIAAAARKVTARGGRVVLCSTTPVKPNARRTQYQRLARLNPMIVSLANEGGYPVLDFWRIFHSQRGWPRLLMDPASPNHPGAAGYALMAQRTFELISSNNLLYRFAPALPSR